MKHRRSTTLLGAAALALAALGTSAAPLAAQEAPAARSVTLGEAIGIALERSRDLESARLDLVGSDQRVREAWGEVMPKVNLNSSYTRNLEVPVQFLPAQLLNPDAPAGELIPLRFGFDNSWYGQVRAEQPLFEAGLFIGIGAAARYQALKTEEVRGTRQTVITQVREAYYGVLLAEEGRRLTENSVNRVRQTLEETRALYRAGMVSEYDALRLEVELAQLEPRLRRAESNLATARRSLAVALGMDGSEPVTVEGSLAALQLDPAAEVPQAPGVEAARPDAGNQAILSFTGLDAPERMSAEELVTLARRNRSDLRQLDLLRRLRETELRYEQAGYLPRVSLFGNYSVTGQDDGATSFFGDDARRIHGKQIGLQVSIPLFSGFQRPARVQQKRAIAQQVEVQQRQATAQVENQVMTLLDELQEARERVDAQQRAVKLAQRGYEIARAQHREGISSQLELTDAENALRESEFNYAEATYDYLVARARLDQATGMVPRVDNR